MIELTPIKTVIDQWLVDCAQARQRRTEALNQWPRHANGQAYSPCALLSIKAQDLVSDWHNPDAFPVLKKLPVEKAAARRLLQRGLDLDTLAPWRGLLDLADIAPGTLALPSPWQHIDGVVCCPECGLAACQYQRDRAELIEYKVECSHCGHRSEGQSRRMVNGDGWLTRRLPSPIHFVDLPLFKWGAENWHLVKDEVNNGYV